MKNSSIKRKNQFDILFDIDKDKKKKKKMKMEDLNNTQVNLVEN